MKAFIERYFFKMVMRWPQDMMSIQRMEQTILNNQWDEARGENDELTWSIDKEEGEDMNHKEKWL